MNAFSYQEVNFHFGFGHHGAFIGTKLLAKHSTFRANLSLSIQHLYRGFSKSNRGATNHWHHKSIQSGY